MTLISMRIKKWLSQLDAALGKLIIRIPAVRRFLKLGLSQSFAIKDSLEIKHIRAGKVIDTRYSEDLMVNAGLAAIAGLIDGVITNFFDYIAIGIGTTAPAVGNTTLESEITTNGGQRAAATCTRTTITITNDTAQLVVTFNFTGTFAVTEAGVLDSAAVGTLACRQTFAALNVVNGDSLQLTFKIQAARP